MIGAAMALKNNYSAEAVETGNLLSSAERLAWREGALDRDAALKMARNRLAELRRSIKEFFDNAENKKYVELMDAMSADLDAAGGRVNAALVEYANTEMLAVKNYFPMERVEPVSSRVSNARELRQMTGSAAGGFQLYVEKGFTKNRINIAPEYQTPINLDAFHVWNNAVERQEHFIAYGGLVKDVNRIYKDPVSPARVWIERRFGSEGIKRLNRVIDDFISPEGQKTKTALDETLSGIRRNYAAAVLGWRATPIIKQYLTSPGAFMAYMKPWEYWAAHVKYFSDRRRIWDEICALSPRMKHRSASLVIEEAKQAARYSYDRKGGAIARLAEAGMGGLELVDNICVAPGWWVLYNKEMERLSKDGETADLGVEERQVKAAGYADDIIEKTQPSGRAETISPMFKGNGELAKAFLQFQQSLNIIWQQTRYDLPVLVRRKQYKQAAGQVMGYAMAGLAVGLITIGFDDDDDDETKNKKITQWAMSQFTDTIPVAGSVVGDLLETAITGKQPYRRNADVVPVITGAGAAAMNLTQAIVNADGAKAAKAFAAAAKTAGYVSGLPVLAVQDAARLFGISDGKEGAGLRPETILGRK
jgi:hypothetical protein